MLLDSRSTFLLNRMDMDTEQVLDQIYHPNGLSELMDLSLNPASTVSACVVDRDEQLGVKRES